MKKNPTLFTVILLLTTGVLFAYGQYTNDMTHVILHTLEFLILFEIVRALTEFILSNNNRIKLRYIVDSAFLFAVRELYVGLVEIHTNIVLGLVITGVSLVGMGALVFLRTKLVKYSPDFFND